MLGFWECVSDLCAKQGHSALDYDFAAQWMSHLCDQLINPACSQHSLLIANHPIVPVHAVAPSALDR